MMNWEDLEGRGYGIFIAVPLSQHFLGENEEGHEKPN
jgi:hypothetical protein